MAFGYTHDLQHINYREVNVVTNSETEGQLFFRFDMDPTSPYPVRSPTLQDGELSAFNVVVSESLGQRLQDDGDLGKKILEGMVVAGAGSVAHPSIGNRYRVELLSNRVEPLAESDGGPFLISLGVVGRALAT